MPRLLISAVLSAAFAFAPMLQAQEINIQHNGLTLNANLALTDESGYENIFLITHGTLAHNGMEIISNWQELLSDEGISSLAINLSLGVDNRHGMYDCKTPHTHKHEDAVSEIGAWVNWLKSKGSESIILGGHSRGGNQTAWYSNQNEDSVIKAQILIAPQTWSESAETEDYSNRYKQPLAPLLSKAKQLPNDTLLKNTDFIYCEDSQVQAGSFVSYYQPTPHFDSPTLLQSATLPTLVFAGSEDETVKDLAKIMLDVNNDKVKTIEIEGANHFFRDLYMDEVLEESLEYLDQL